ncbi:MAG TPA: transposase [Gemmatimonadaceae bacterium]|nr:transposase [Gemmatimonadaceae bacterium]
MELACVEPIAEGLQLTHWSSADLARQAVEAGIAEALSPATVRRILAAVDLQPHRTRYWRTAHLGAEFKARAEKVLWCYAHAERLAQEGLWVVATDEMPNRQVLERRPIRRAVPGAIEQREFEYVRHGTVNVLTFLVIHTGRMDAVCLEANDAAHYIPALERFRRQQGRSHREVRGMFLLHDGGPSHTARLTRDYLAADDWWRPRLTPAHASWLNQAELLNNAFDRRYLRRGSWESPDAYATHVRASAREYNRRYAHPFEWTWTNHQMRRWFADHAAPGISGITYEQGH